MQIFTNTVVGVLALAVSVLANPCKPATPTPPTVNVLHEFLPAPSWAENLIWRANGQLLVTSFYNPVLYQVDPDTGDTIQLYAWDSSDYIGVLGIAETTTDVFYVAATAILDPTTYATASGVNSIFRVDMTLFALDVDGTTVVTPPTVTKVTDITEANFLNGLITLDDSRVLVADSYNGCVYVVNVNTGDYSVAVDDPLMRFDYVADPAANLGINGIKLYGGDLYWTNSIGGILGRIAFDAATATATGSSSVAVSGIAFGDDFVIRASDGAVFICQNQLHTLSVAYLQSGATVKAKVVVDSTTTASTLVGPAAVRFGLGSESARLYVATTGGYSSSVPGTISYLDSTGF